MHVATAPSPARYAKLSSMIDKRLVNIGLHTITNSWTLYHFLWTRIATARAPILLILFAVLLLPFMAKLREEDFRKSVGVVRFRRRYCVTHFNTGLYAKVSR